VPGSGVFSKSAPIDKESKTLKAAFLSLQEEGVKAATHHLEFATKITNDVVKPLENFHKTKETERKKAIAEGQKRTKAHLDAKANHDKAQDTYKRSMKEAEQATEAHEKAKTEHDSGPEAKKKQLADNEKRAAQKAIQLTEKSKAAEAAYQKAVETVNEVVKENFSTHLPPVLDALQQLEEDRYAMSKAVLESYQKEFRALPDLLIERAEAIATVIAALDLDADLTEFADAKKGPNSEPEEVKFVPYKEPPAGSSTTSTSTTSSEETPKEEKEDKSETEL